MPIDDRSTPCPVPSPDFSTRGLGRNDEGGGFGQLFICQIGTAAGPSVLEMTVGVLDRALRRNRHGLNDADSKNFNAP